MGSQPQNPEFRKNPENFHPCVFLSSASTKQGTRTQHSDYSESLTSKPSIPNLTLYPLSHCTPGYKFKTLQQWLYLYEPQHVISNNVIF